MFRSYWKTGFFGLAVLAFVYFFIFIEDIPTKVSINEAIDIAKEFSTKNSGKFVNGVLDAILMKLKEQKRINKKGKGLIGEKKSAVS